MAINDLLAWDRQMSQIRLVDAHIHSTYSDGRASLEEIITRGVSRGLKVIAITDHVWRTSDWLPSYGAEIDRLRKEYPMIQILKGAEAKVIDDHGNVDITEAQARYLDLVMGVVHRRAPASKNYPDLAQLPPWVAARLERDRILAMMENPLVSIIGHPMRTYEKFFWKLRPELPPYPMEYIAAIVRKARAWDRIIEVNEKLHQRQDLFLCCLKFGAPFTLGSDAHHQCEVGQIDYQGWQKLLDHYQPDH